MEKCRNILFYIIFGYAVDYLKIEDQGIFSLAGPSDIIIIFDIHETEAKRIADLLDKYVEVK